MGLEAVQTVLVAAEGAAIGQALPGLGDGRDGPPTTSYKLFNQGWSRWREKDFIT